MDKRIEFLTFLKSNIRKCLILDCFKKFRESGLLLNIWRIIYIYMSTLVPNCPIMKNPLKRFFWHLISGKLVAGTKSGLFIFSIWGNRNYDRLASCLLALLELACLFKVSYLFNSNYIKVAFAANFYCKIKKCKLNTKINYFLLLFL